MPLQQGIPRASTGMCTLEEPQLCPAKWYFSKEEIEDHSPSRKEGIDLKYETHLRKLYCSFLQDLGMKLKVPQLTISCAMLLCHRFYMRHSHAKNDWQTVATACIFLACKVQETPRFLNDVVVVAYEKMNEWDPSASRRIRQREAFDKQKELILSGERLLLSTIAFDLNIQLPYKPLVMALKKLNISSDLAKPAWNFVNDWLCTTMCLQYKPHYIAAGSMFLAAKLQKVKLLTEKGRAWWMEFEVSLKQLEEVIQEMRTLLERDKKQALPPSNGRVTRYKTSSGKPLTSSSQSCISSESNNDRHCSNGALAEDRSYGDLLEFDSNSKVSESEKCIPVKDVLSRQSSDNTVSAISVVGDHVGENLIRTGELDQSLRSKAHAVHDMSTRIDVNRIRGALKKRKCNTIINKKVEEMDAEIDSEAWIESELENGIELGTIATTSKEKKQRKL